MTDTIPEAPAPLSKPLILRANTSYRDSFSWLDADGVQVDLTGWTGRIVVREKNVHGPIMAEGTSPTQVATGPNGCAVYLTPAQTLAMSGKAGRYAVSVTSPDAADTVILAEGPATIRPTEIEG